MTILKRLLKRDSGVVESPCPRCGIPAPASANDCSACGWDLRESHTSADAGSYVTTDSTEPERTA